MEILKVSEILKISKPLAHHKGWKAQVGAGGSAAVALEVESWPVPVANPPQCALCVDRDIKTLVQRVLRRQLTLEILKLHCMARCRVQGNWPVARACHLQSSRFPLPSKSSWSSSKPPWNTMEYHSSLPIKLCRSSLTKQQAAMVVSKQHGS